MHNPSIIVEGITSQYSDVVEFEGEGSFAHSYQLPEKGAYRVNVLGMETKVIYQKNDVEIECGYNHSTLYFLFINR